MPSAEVTEVDLWFVGDEGCGKSTLLRQLYCAAKDEDPDACASIEEDGSWLREQWTGTITPKASDERTLTTRILVEREEILLRFLECTTEEVSVGRFL